eukprot:357794-Chlamydomonas_euryale.AAC.5
MHSHWPCCGCTHSPRPEQSSGQSGAAWSPPPRPPASVPPSPPAFVQRARTWTAMGSLLLCRPSALKTANQNERGGDVAALGAPNACAS